MRARSVLSALLLATLPSVAQATGSLTISLTDSRGRPVEGTVTITPMVPGIARGCSTSGGECVVTALDAGRYQVSATTLRNGTVTPRVMLVRNGSQRLNLTAQGTPQPESASMRGQTVQGRTGSSGQGTTHTGQVSPGQVPVAQAGAEGVPGGQPIGATVQVPRNTPIVRSDRPTATSANMQIAAGNAPQGSRDLGSGRSVSIAGSSQDQRGRPVEGTVTVAQGGRVVGTASSRGGAFQLFDLEAGQYELSFAALSGQRTSRQATVRAGAQIRVVLTVQR